MNSWQIWVDTGGTFTDCIAIDPSQQQQRLKVLSSGVLRGRIVSLVSARHIQVEFYWPVKEDIYANYVLHVVGHHRQWQIKSVDTATGVVEVAQPIDRKTVGSTAEIHTHEEVPVFAARLITKTLVGESFPPIEMKLGSTRGTNAILERRGAKTALIVTKGFKDLLLIGNQQRPDLFALNVRKEIPLYDLVAEVNERIDSVGSVLVPLKGSEIDRVMQQIRKRKIDTVAVALINSYRNNAHEQLLKTALQKEDISFVSVSSELSGQIKILQRAETTVVNAYLAPIIYKYVRNIEKGLAHARLRMMSSSGSLVNAQFFYPKDSLLSGPAGGVVGAAATARLSGIEKLITFDMGGTSTDVALYNQRFDYRYESKVGSLKILSPSLAIETIAAGGGSICSFDGFRFTVGPESAGANPGPACYGAGGPLTITDVNLLLNRIDDAEFSLPLSREKSDGALLQLIQQVKKQTGKAYTRKQVLHSLIQIANEKMADAIRKVSTQAGHNPADYTLLSFGGAGGQHACALATMLNMKRVLIPYDAGLLSAYGIGHAKVERFNEELVLAPLPEGVASLPERVNKLFELGKKQLQHEGYNSLHIRKDKVLAFLRFRGQESTLEIEIYQETISEVELRALFKKQYELIFGHWLDQRVIEIESVRVITSVTEHETQPSSNLSGKYQPEGRKVNGRSMYRWESLRAGALVHGPAIIVSNNSTTVVDTGWQFFLDDNNNGILSALFQAKKIEKHAFEAELELFTNRFTAVAQEMGAMLQRTSFSVNVKERLDFSCALLDKDGFLVVNAPHIPVHLGSLGVCVREVLRELDLNEGDVIITNHPAFGGSHLPDVTLIKPVYFKKKCVGYVANRAHHAEIGGKKPGSMPADATKLEEEGVIIAPTYLVRNGEAQWNHIHQLFTTAVYPTRLWEENQADLNGALASVNYGEYALQTLCRTYSAKKVTDFMSHLRTHAAGLMKSTMAHLPSKKLTATEKLDDGSILKVTIQKTGRKLVIDFTGSSPVHRGNLNATRAIVQSVALYVLRLLVNKAIPMNEGLMEQVRLIVPAGQLNPDFSVSPLPAVVGGNTEVSQRLTDVMIKALGLAACSQGTMNNFLFGNERFGYYETICGGTGAGPGFDGADAVHQHMTNTRITDPELLELRYPVLLQRFEIRVNSGGKGEWRGGDGITREVLFNESLDINLLTQHRVEKPYGMKGGDLGKAGRQYIVRADGSVTTLKGMDSAHVTKGDRLVIETPGGGGYGKSNK